MGRRLFEFLLLNWMMVFQCMCSLMVLLFCQRWVSEKLSVESLRDLELFGGKWRRMLDIYSVYTH